MASTSRNSSSSLPVNVAFPPDCTYSLFRGPDGLVAWALDNLGYRFAYRFNESFFRILAHEKPGLCFLYLIRIVLSHLRNIELKAKTIKNYESIDVMVYRRYGPTPDPLHHGPLKSVQHHLDLQQAIMSTRETRIHELFWRLLRDASSVLKLYRENLAMRNPGANTGDSDPQVEAECTRILELTSSRNRGNNLASQVWGAELEEIADREKIIIDRYPKWR